METIVERLNAAAAAKDTRFLDRYLRELRATLADRQDELLTAILREDIEPGVQLRLGVLLGRIGDQRVLDRIEGYLEELADHDLDMSYGADGRPSPSRSIANALLSNTLRIFLKRPEMRANTIDLCTRSGFSATTPAAVRRVLLGTLATEGDDSVFARFTGLFEVPPHESARREVLGALHVAKNPRVAPYLVDWYERFPSHRRVIAMTLATSMDVAVTYPFLRERALADVQDEGRESPALLAIEELARRQGAAGFLRSALESEQDANIRWALLRAVASRPTPENGEAILRAATADPSDRVRARACEFLPHVLEPEVAFAALRGMVAADLPRAVRRGVYSGLIALSDPSNRLKDDARRVLIGALSGSSRDDTLDAARVLLRTAVADRAEIVKLLREALPTFRSDETRSALAALLEEESG